MNMILKVFCLNLIIVLLLIQTSDERSILVRDEELPTIDEQLYERSEKEIRTRIDAEITGRVGTEFGKLYLKLAIFYDKYLLNRFDKNRKELKRFMSSIVYTSQLFYNRPKIKEYTEIRLLVVRFEEYPGQTNTTIVGHNNELLADFCDHTRTVGVNSSDTTSVLFTGLNIWSKDNKRMDSDLGLSYSDRICNRSSCAIVETREFMAANIFTHELGHILSVSHDGEGKVGCHPHKYIMTAQYSLNRLNEWSECSAVQLRNKLREMRDNDELGCMMKEDKVVPGFKFSEQNLPGVEWPIDKQCQFGLGPKYKAITTEPYTDICRTLVCRNVNDWFQRKRGYPALEGTLCGTKLINGIKVKHYCKSENCTARPEITAHRIKDLNSNYIPFD